MNVNESPSKQRCGQPAGMLWLAVIVFGIITAIILTVTSVLNYQSANASAPSPKQPVTFTQAAFRAELPTKALLAQARTEAATRSIVRKPIATQKPKTVAKPKPVAKPAPAPVKKVQAPAPAPKPRNVEWQSATIQSIFAKYPASIEQFAWCVVKHESWNSGRWTAENPYSTASGAFQFIDGTFEVWLKRAGLSGSRHAADNSPAIQTRVFIYAVTHGGKSAWRGTNCPGT